MKSVLHDGGTAVVSLIILIAGLFILPIVLPAGYGYIAAIVLFIIVMSSGGYYIYNFLN
ncbi:MAG: hypothetical protein U9N40_03135 [Euryarchaeota archaeon]|nr:hypothetical protein [Euryarchaeota archaeon]